MRSVGLCMDAGNHAIERAASCICAWNANLRLKTQGFVRANVYVLVIILPDTVPARDMLERDQMSSLESPRKMITSQLQCPTHP